MQTSNQIEEVSEPIVKHVIKRNGSQQPIDIEKIRNRFVNKAYGLNMNYINFDVIVNKVSEGIYSGNNYFYSQLTTFFILKTLL
jgi:transcriptional regulator NrdR family protein